MQNKLMKQIFLQKILIKISQPKNFKMYFPNMLKLSHLLLKKALTH